MRHLHVTFTGLEQTGIRAHGLLDPFGCGLFDVWVRQWRTLHGRKVTILQTCSCAFLLPALIVTRFGSRHAFLF